MSWTRGPTIGRGSSAVVSLASASAGDLFAVKSTDLSSSTSLQKEEHFLSQLYSPYIVKSLGSDITYENNKHVYNLFLEYLPGGTLSDLFKNHGGSVEENAIRLYAFQILQGLNYLHGKGLVHCDIKGQNILIGNDGGLKIADFGCAKWREYSGRCDSFSGTPAYMAPEVARGEDQSFAADIWAMGCTVIEMATGGNPWPEMKDPVSALFRIAYSGDVPEFPGWFSGEAKDFLVKCFMRDSKERWTAAELLQHRFFSFVEQSEGHIITRKSPTSVMDQGFWDDLEVSDCYENPVGIALSPDSPAVRITALAGDDAPWTEEAEWLTVRGDQSQDFFKTNQDFGDFDNEYPEMNQDFEDYTKEFVEIEGGNRVFEDSIDAGDVIFDEEGIQFQAWILMEDCFNGDTSGTLTVTHTEGVKSFFLYSELLILEDMLMELFLRKDHRFLKLFSVFIYIFRFPGIIFHFSESQLCFWPANFIFVQKL